MFTYGIDANVLTREKRTGTERYVSVLLKEMQNFPLQDDEQVVLYVSRRVKELEDLPTGWEQRILSWPPRKAWTHGRLSWELFTRTPNVFFSPAHEIPLLTPRTKIVATVHDVAFRFFPSVYSLAGRKRQEWSLKRQLNLASHLITVSETTKQDLASNYGIPQGRMTATPLAIHPDRFKGPMDQDAGTLDTYDLSEVPYFLTISRLEEKKNIVTLIKAFSLFKRRAGHANKTQLVLGGSLGFGGEHILKAIEESGYAAFIKRLGYVPEKDLPALLRNAQAYVFPTHYEGFGIPALEAMAAGIPLVASRIPALQEVAGPAALFVSPKDVEGWALAMQRMQNESVLRERLVEEGGRQVQKFSWKKTAEKTWRVLRSVKNYG